MARQIALISEHASPLSILGGTDCGGQNLYVGQVAKSLAAMGHDIDIFTRRDSEVLPETAEWVNGIRIVHVPAGPSSFVRKEDLLPFMDDFTAYVLNFCRCQRKAYDLIHANFWMSALVAAEVKRALNIPFVVTFHALGRVRRQYQREADQFPDIRFAIEDRIVAEADHIVAEAPQEEEDLIGLYNADPAKISIIPCGFDPTELCPISKALARISLGLPPEGRLILQLGRIVPRKGIDNVIRGIARLSKLYDIEVKALIVGGGSDEPDCRITPEIGRLQALASSEGIAEAVTFVGRRGRETLKYYYSAADIFVTTPWYEPFGITPVEAMACGTPVVGSNVGGIKFTVRDSETGYLVPANDPESLAEKLAHLYTNPKLLSVFSRQAVQRVNDLFTWEKVGKALSSLYEGVLDTRQPDRHKEPEQLLAIDRRFEIAGTALRETQHRLRTVLVDAAALLSRCFARGGKVLTYGQGQSATTADYLAASLSDRYRLSRHGGLPALCLNRGSPYLPDDASADHFYARQVEMFGRAEDVLIAMSADGYSRSLLETLQTAHRIGLHCIVVLGMEGTDTHRFAEVALMVPSLDRDCVEEVHFMLIHLLCGLVEKRLADEERFSGQPSPIMWERLRRQRIPAPRVDAASG